MTTATSPLTYNGLVTSVAVLGIYNTETVSGVVHIVDGGTTISALDGQIPQMLNYSELRIQRDCDLLPALTSNTYNLTVGTNEVDIPVGDFVTIQTVNATVNGQQTPLLPVSKEFIQNVCPTGATPAPPAYFAMIGGDASGGNTTNNILFGPPADNTYPISVRGTVRLPSLAKQNTNPQAGTATTFISTWLPDLLVMGCMIWIAQFQRNFSSTADDPQMPVNYESQYQALLKGAVVEEARKRFSAGAWTSMGPTPIATPGR